MKGIGRATLAVCIVAFGCLAARAQTQYNTRYGTGALNNYPYSGYYNSAFGYDALYTNGSTGYYNTATGFEALYSNNLGDYSSYGNTATGAQALYANTTGYYNTATGQGSLYSNTTANYNTATGFDALRNSTGAGNTATGAYALESNTTGAGNMATGEGALYSNNSGGYNSAFGYQALYSNTSGTYNSGVGDNAGSSGTTGSYNISVGYQAGYNNTTGSYNIDIGNEGESSDNGVIRIGGSSGGQSAFFAAGIYGVNVSGVPLYVTSSGQLGIVSSSMRFKKDVQNMGDASNAIYRLRPVTYRYKKPFADGSDPVEYGLIAEEVARVYPDLVARNADGTIQTVEYQKLTPMMLNELQRQHQILEQMEKSVDQHQQTIQLLRAQATEIVQPLEKRLAALEGANSAAMRLDGQLERK